MHVRDLGCAYATARARARRRYCSDAPASKKRVFDELQALGVLPGCAGFACWLISWPREKFRFQLIRERSDEATTVHAHSRRSRQSARMIWKWNFRLASAKATKGGAGRGGPLTTLNHVKGRAACGWTARTKNPPSLQGNRLWFTCGLAGAICERCIYVMLQRHSTRARRRECRS